MIAVAPDNQTVAAQLHHDGWLEARGQVLQIGAFPELYRVVGRTWTSDRVAEGRFAVPQLLDRSQRRLSSDNPFGVLGPGDLVTSGTTGGRTPYVPLTLWIFAGRPVTADSAGGAAVR
jgi:microcystin-dependent protein